MTESDRALAEANRLIAYHSPIARQLTLERTSYSSQLIPVTAYIAVACTEAWFRYPELMRQIDAAHPAAAIGAAGRRPGSRVNTVHLWSIANFWLTGRRIASTVFPDADDPRDAHAVLDFWERCTIAFRGDDGTRMAHDAGGVVRPYDAGVIDALVAAARPVAGDDQRSRVARLNATIVNFLFLLYMDTRVGTGDTGPYLLPDGGVLVVRDFYELRAEPYWWGEAARSLPYRNLTAAFVLDGVDVRVSDFGTAFTQPDDYVPHIRSFALCTTDTPDGALAEVPEAEWDDLVGAVRAAHAGHYRDVATMSHDEMIRAGAHVYFSFLRPFAEVAGVAEDIDWTTPLALPEPLYQLLSALQGEHVTFDLDGEYYPQIGGDP